MPLQDFAIVIGANRYRHRDLNELQGAIGDTVDLLEWLISESGGGVPVENVRWLCTPDDCEDALVDVVGAVEKQQAKRDNILSVLEEFIERGDAGDGEKIGRRLYLHFSGHGAARGIDEACFFASDHSEFIDRYVIGRQVANIFVEMAIFKEVFLFMDCCQDYDAELDDLPIGAHHTPDPDAARRVRRIYAFASQFGRKAREKEVDGQSRGIFSRSVLEGLRGAAATAERQITVGSLKSYVHRRFIELRDPSSDQNPIFSDYEDDDVVIATDVEPVFAEVTVELTEPGKGFQVLDGGNNLEPVDAVPEDLDDYRLRIRLIPGKWYLFVVPTPGAVDQFERMQRIKVEEGGAHVSL